MLRGYRSWVYRCGATMASMRLLVSLLLPIFGFAAAGELRTDIPFAHAGGIELTLDAWTPAGEGPFPTVIVVHGGGWENGDKQTYVKPLFPPLTEAGFAWFTINYRLAPEHRFPACTDDAAAAVRWVRQNARMYKVDPGRIALMGESAGGHIVAYLGAALRGAESVAAVVAFYPVTDLLHWERQRGKIGHHMGQLLGLTELNAAAEAKLTEASPVTYVHPNMPPFLFIHGTADTGVPFDQSTRMCDQMKAVGARCEIYPVEGAPHGVGPWEKNPAHQTYKKKMVEWLEEILD